MQSSSEPMTHPQAPVARLTLLLSLVLLLCGILTSGRISADAQEGGGAPTSSDDPNSAESAANPLGAAVAAEPAAADSFVIAHGWYRERRFADAAPVLRRVLNQTLRDSGEVSPGAARVLDVLVPCLWQMGKSQEPETIRLARQVVDMKEELFGSDDPEVARSLFSVGVIRAMAGAYAEAEPIFARVLAIRETGLPADHEEIASSINALANIRYLNADFAGALPLYRRSLRLIEGTKGPLDPQSIAIRGNVANNLAQLGKYEEARTLLEHQIALLEVEGLEIEDLGYAYSLLGQIFVVLGDFDEALRARRRSLEIREAFHPADHPRIAESLLNLGNTLWRMGDLAEGRALINRARETWERVYGADHPYLSSFDEALGRIAFEKGNLAESRRLHERVLESRRRSIGDDTAEVAEVLQALARIAREEGRLSDARDQLGKALEIADAELGPQHPLVAKYAYELAISEFLSGDDAAALQHALQAERVFAEHLRLMLRGLPERQALRYAQGRVASLDLVITLLDVLEDPQVVQDAWDALIRTRAIVLDEMAARTRRQAMTADSTLAGLIAEHQRTSMRLANLVVRGLQETEPVVRRRLVADAHREAEQAERRLAQATRFEDPKGEDVGWSEVAAALPEGSAVVAYVRFQKHDLEPDRSQAGRPWYRAFVLTSREAVPVSIDIGDGDGVDDLVADWRAEAALGPQHSTRSPEETLRACDQIGRLLRGVIWDPVAERLGNVSRVFVIPDGQLHLLSLVALPDSEGGYLVESDLAFHRLSAERELAAPAAGSVAGDGALIVGAPDFDDAAAAGSETVSFWEQARARIADPGRLFRGARPDCREMRSRSFPPLPGSLREAQQVAGFWRDELAQRAQPNEPAGSSVLLLTGSAASETAFKQLAPGRRILHLATHAYFLDRKCSPEAEVGLAALDVGETKPPPNPLLLSGLALAGANARETASADKDDGILTAQEIAALELSGTHWVVLSACESGTGPVMNGEGVCGLARAFRIAGARTLVTSLWPVDDEAARLWMAAFCEQGLREDRGAIGAVRAASRSILEQRRRRGESTHPFYWAPFVATGDWR